MTILGEYKLDADAPITLEEFNSQYNDGTWLTLGDAAHVANRCRYAIVYQIKRGRLPIIMIGGYIFINRARLKQLWPDHHRTNHRNRTG